MYSLAPFLTILAEETEKSSNIGDDITQVILILSALFIFMLVFIRWKVKRGDEQREREMNLTDSPRRKQQQEIADSARNLLLEVENVSRQVNAKLGTKMRVLDELIQQADKKIKRLEELAGEEKATEKPEDIPETEKLDPPPEVAREADAVTSKIYEMADSGREILEISKETGIPRGEVELILSLRKKAGK